MVIKGFLKGDYVYVKERGYAQKLYDQGYGELLDAGLELHPLEAAYLVWSGKMNVFAQQKPIMFEDLLKLFVSNSRGFLKYIVYSDLRRRDRLVVYERATDFLRLYPKGTKIGKAASKDLVLTLSEDRPIPHKYILDMIERAAKLRKRLILAVVDDELNVTYYRAQNFIPSRRDMRLAKSDGIPTLSGIIVGDRVLVFDRKGGEAYANGFWGHPLGIDKPEPFKLYEVPLQLPIIEALYLVSKGKLVVRDYNGKELNLEELRRIFSSLRDGSGVKEVVYRYWRELGYIPKAGSKYGADYLIYEKGPGLEHAPYLCLTGSIKDKIRPVDLIRSGRVATSVRKDLVVSLVSDDHVISYKMTWFRP